MPEPQRPRDRAGRADAADLRDIGAGALAGGAVEEFVLILHAVRVGRALPADAQSPALFHLLIDLRPAHLLHLLHHFHEFIHHDVSPITRNKSIFRVVIL